ncbi:hypothetical protein Droror1_Dr00001277 [Drosera rotundifolia]
MIFTKQNIIDPHSRYKKKERNRLLPFNQHISISSSMAANQDFEHNPVRLMKNNYNPSDHFSSYFLFKALIVIIFLFLVPLQAPGFVENFMFDREKLSKPKNTSIKVQKPQNTQIIRLESPTRETTFGRTHLWN